MSAAGDASTGRVQIAIAVVEREGSFLIGLRPAGVPLAGYWEFPGGKIEPDETAEASAVRECLEETGLAVCVTGSYPQTTHVYEHAQVQLFFFACAPVQQNRVLPERFRWVAAAELGQYKFPPANEAILRLLTGRSAE